MFCVKCGATIPDESIYCAKCGAVQSTPQEVTGNRQVPKKKKGCMTFVIIAIVAVIAVIALFLIVGMVVGDESTESVDSDYAYDPAAQYERKDLELDVRDHYTEVKGGGKDVFTVMVYMIGSDLESDGGCATNDLVEMINAQVGGNVNLIVQTGGTRQWQNDLIDSDTVQRWKVSADGLTEIGDIGDVSMVESSTLTDFVRFSEHNYPANRYGLIFWNHGGGTVWGFGADENHDGALMLKDIDRGLTDAGVKFDFIGYDACLMATIENAYMLEKHADYMIASEELEPGLGWDYSAWLPLLAANPSISTIQLGQIIVDTFINHNNKSDTLSVVELREIPYTYKQLSEYVGSAEISMEKNSDSFYEISNARSNAKSYYEGQSEMVDIVDLVSNMDNTEAKDVVDAINSAVKYRNICSLRGSNGLSMYFPYSEINEYSNTREDVSTVGFDENYLDFFDYFVNVLAGGQMKFNGRTSVGASIGNGPAETPADYSQNSWYDPAVSQIYSESYENNEYTEREIVEKDGGYVLSMSEKEWENITDIQLWAMVSDGEGYIDLGADDMWEIDENDLLIDFDNTWVAIDGQVVPFYTEKNYEENPGEENTAWYNYGYVPAVLNNSDNEQKSIDIILKWDNEKPNGYVAGYRFTEVDGGPVGKGLHELKQGDKLTFLCDYYDFDGNFVSMYEYGDVLTVGSTAPVVSYEDIGENKTLVCFRLTDIYRNMFYTQSVEFTFE
ncbi:MAG: clostripain-related cysteine peptidase [Oscillospiraceae bacterium]